MSLYYRFLEKTLAEWLDTFAGVVFPYGPVNNIAGAFSDPQVIYLYNTQNAIGIPKSPTL